MSNSMKINKSGQIEFVTNRESRYVSNEKCQTRYERYKYPQIGNDSHKLSSVLTLFTDKAASPHHITLVYN